MVEPAYIKSTTSPKLPEILGLLCCPNCAGRLQLGGDQLTCGECGRGFPVVDGILDLRNDPAAHHAFSVFEDDEAVVDQARQVGWLEAMMTATAQPRHGVNSEDRREWVLSEGRGDFRYLLPIAPDSVVLDVASGWGAVAAAFARMAGLVIAVDLHLPALQYSKIRNEQEGIRNVVYILGDVLHLPIRSNTCDFVVVNGVLQWIALSKPDHEPGVVHRKALKKVFGALKTGGKLYLAGENRYSFRNLAGARDRYTHLRWISILPRPLARVYSRLVRHKEYLEMNHSLAEIKGMLKAVGFVSQDVYFPVPNGEFFRYITRLENRDVWGYLLGNFNSHPRFGLLGRIGGRIARWIPLRVVRGVWPSFAIIAEKT